MSASLFDVDASGHRKTGGPVYQGVCKSIRALESLNSDELDPVVRGKVKVGGAWAERRAGLIAQARSLAASIDRESGHDPRGKQASGVSLSALHAQLAEILTTLDPAGDVTGEQSGLDKLAAAWAADDEAARATGSTA